MQCPRLLSRFRGSALVVTALVLGRFVLFPTNISGSGRSDAVSKQQKLSERLEQVNEDVVNRGLHNFPDSKDKLLTGYAYGEFFDWDLYFENIYLSYYGVDKYDFTNLKVFLSRQEPDGFVSRTLVNPRKTQMFKPFMAQLAVLGSQQSSSYEWLDDDLYKRLQKYIDRWFAYDSDHNGLPTWNSSDASGMDNQLSRSGYFDSNFDEGVDLASYLYRELKAMALISEKLGKKKEAVKYEEHANQLAQLINDVFWDDKDGFYYDRNEKTGTKIPVKSVAGFFPLWAGVVPPDRAKRLIGEHLMNEHEFWSAYPVPSYALTEPDFYEGTKQGECNWRGNTWTPTNYMIFHGLMRYGYLKEAQMLADKTYEMALDKNSVTREYYDSKTGEGYGMRPFWGWSSLAYAMPLELKYMYDPTELSGKIRPILSETLGLKFPLAPEQATQSATSTNADLQAGISELDVAPVWSGDPVNFSLLTHGDQQYVAFYGASRALTVAQRTLGNKLWHYTTLPTSVGWDSHNYIAMAFDRDGYLHVSGNMHVAPLIYFRSTRPGDASSLVQVPSMTGKNESQVTYPGFIHGPDGVLIFEYRSGKSGAGDNYSNRYDEATKSWQPLTEQPLFHGGNDRNAYEVGPVFGEDGWYHEVWVWRESRFVESNHDLSYARSHDLIHWQTADGTAIKLPITVSTPGVTIDPVPMHGGLINGGQTVGFDSNGNLVIAYTKYDSKGSNQLYFANRHDGKWDIRQASNWTYHWDMQGGGSIPIDVVVTGPLKASDGNLSIRIHHISYGTGEWQVDPKTMHLTGALKQDVSATEPGAKYAPPAGSPMIQNVMQESTGTPGGKAKYTLTWNTLGRNRDQPRPEGAPPPTMLRLLVSP